MGMVMVLVILFALLVLLILCAVQNARLKHKLRMADTIYRNTNMLWSIVDLSTKRVPIASTALIDVVGLSQETLLEHDPREFIDPDDMKAFESALKEQPRAKVFERVRLRLRNARYGWQWYESYGFFLSENLVFFSYYPINERIRISEELSRTKHELSIMLDNSFSIIWTLDCATRRLNLMTDVTRERFGVDDHKAGPISSNEDYFLKEDLVEFRKILNERIKALLKSGDKQDKPQSFAVHVKNRDGSVVRFITRSTLEKNEVGGFMLYGVSRLAINDELH